MPGNTRHARILKALEQNGFVSVTGFSALLDVSEVTIRRDLEKLEAAGRLRRTHGGALALREASPVSGAADQSLTSDNSAAQESPAGLTDRIDVLISTPVDPAFDRALLDRASQRHIPVVAESVAIPGAKTLVAPDNEAAARELGRWAGGFANSQFDGRVCLLDLTFDLPNTRARSEGFLAGLRETAPEIQLVISINASSNADSSAQITRDVLAVHPEINMIFAINDATAEGACRACQQVGIADDALALFTFGIEGATFLDSLTKCGYCPAGLAMFPELVGPTCVEAALAAFEGRPLPPHLVTPHVVVTPANLGDYYRREGDGWSFNWSSVSQYLDLPLPLDPPAAPARRLPRRIGMIVPFSGHEWYRNLAACMRAHAERYGIALDVVDAEQSRRNDLAMRRREIARAAAQLVQSGDAILIDAGPITAYLAEELVNCQNITVITNSLPAVEALRDRTGVTLIIAGGLLRQGSDAFHGPTTEHAIRELRADKLFLSATGVSSEFGVSHDNLAEVATKQAMVRVAREVILVAEHTRFGVESVAQVAPLRAVTRVITDSALPATTRLELSKTGIEVIIART